MTDSRESHLSSIHDQINASTDLNLLLQIGVKIGRLLNHDSAKIELKSLWTIQTFKILSRQIDNFAKFSENYSIIKALRKSAKEIDEDRIVSTINQLEKDLYSEAKNRVVSIYDCVELIKQEYRIECLEGKKSHLIKTGSWYLLNNIVCSVLNTINDLIDLRKLWEEYCSLASIGKNHIPHKDVTNVFVERSGKIYITDISKCQTREEALNTLYSYPIFPSSGGMKQVADRLQEIQKTYG